MDQNVIKKELEDAILREKSIVVESEGEEHDKAVKNFIELIEAYNKIIKTENEHELGIERILADRDIGEKANEIREEQARFDKIIGIASLAASIGTNVIYAKLSINSLDKMLNKSLLFETEGSFTSCLGKVTSNEIPKKMINAKPLIKM